MLYDYGPLSGDQEKGDFYKLFFKYEAAKKAAKSTKREAYALSDDQEFEGKANRTNAPKPMGMNEI